jgi:hypothetical protein
MHCFVMNKSVAKWRRSKGVRRIAKFFAGSRSEPCTVQDGIVISKEPAMNRLISRLPHLSDRFVFRSTLVLWVVAVLLG